MSFPYTYNKTIEVINSKVEQKNIFKLLYSEIFNSKVENIHIDGNTISFSSKNSLFKLEYDIKISLENKNDDVNVNYEINLSKLTNLILILLVLLAFFSFVSIKIFLILAVLFAVGFFYINLFFNKSYIENIIYKVIGFNELDMQGSDFFSDKQLEWINNPNKCSACGHEITNIDLLCPDCGLKVKPNNWTIPLDTTKFSEKTVHYNYKK